jgi:uncharacterized repeat protein (TIGR01451 family)
MQRIPRFLAIVFIMALLISAVADPIPAAPTNSWKEKIDLWVFSAAQVGETEFLVFLSEQADLSAADTLESKAAKGAYVYETLSSLAEATQKPLRASLDSQGVTYKSFWVVNALWVRGNQNLIEQIAQRNDVAHIYANPQVKLSLPEEKFVAAPQSPTAIEWNITKINADDVWAAGYTGQNVVIGGADTGYDWDHPALINQYRGWDGATADHDYNWHDATGDSPNTPVDPYWHGTHTMGTMVGDDGSSNQIGVAPGAKWIGCRNMDDDGNGTPDLYIECYQWFIAPTRTDNSDPDPTKAPHVINNSWSCPPSEGCAPNSLLTAVQNVRSAGILTAHSAGNSGSSCSSIDDPAAIYAESFTVGAVDNSDTIASFSSRGPVTVDGSNRRKPDISAPGVSVRSSLPGTGYGTSGGTSMAAPHIAGVVALLISARPSLAGQVDQLETIIEQTAVPLYTSQGCGDDTPSSLPNNVYGYGRVDAWAAFVPQLSLAKTVSDDNASPGSILTYTLSTQNTGMVSSAHNVILEDELPEGTDFITATLPFTLTGETITWAIGDLAPGESVEAELIVEVPITTPVGTIVNNLYSARSDEVSPVIGDPVSTYIHMLAVEKSAPEVVVRGFPLTYTLKVTNLQPDTDTHNVVLTDTLPDRTSFLTATGSYTVTGRQVTWELGDLEAGASTSVDMIVRVPQGISGTITNDSYIAASDEVTTPATGEPVHTFVQVPGLSWTEDTSCNGHWLMPEGILVCLPYLQNTGNYTDTFELSLGNINGEAQISTTEVTLGAGQSALITVTIMAPADAPNGDMLTTTVTATSSADSALSESLTTTTWIYIRFYLPLVFEVP